jgi:hypothetical protein
MMHKTLTSSWVIILGAVALALLAILLAGSGVETGPGWWL